MPRQARLLLLATTSCAIAAASGSCDSTSDIRQVPFLLYGAGGVGSELLQTIIKSRSLHEVRYGLRFAAMGVCDSSGAVLASGGELTDATIAELLSHKSCGGRLSAAMPAQSGVSAVSAQGEVPSDFAKRVALEVARDNPGCILVDCSATDATTPALTLVGSAPVKVASANKKPFSGALADWAAFSAADAASRVRYESTVMAGVPTISALQRVVASGDEVSSLAGSFSGTLGYVMSALQTGAKFSEVVAKAKSLGFTEPDPRDDLGGVDVARKALILARTVGLKLEMADVAVEPLYPPEMAALSVDDFMEALPTLDDPFAQRVASASAGGKVLRYVGSVDVTAGKLVVGLQAVGADSPLGALQGSDNLVEMATSVYKAPAPLVLRGAGAGLAGTAAGVLADMVELAQA